MREKIFYAEHFYNKVSKDSEALKKIADDFPLSSLAGFLLLYHYKKTSHPDFENLAKKMALLFNNEHWLQFQLDGTLIKSERQELIHNEEPEEFAKNPGEFEEGQPAEISSVQSFTDNQKNELLVQNSDAVTVETAEDSHGTDSDRKSATSQEEDIGNVNEKPENEIPVTNLTRHSLMNLRENLDNTPDVNDAPPAFEPLYTVDYFASQGIKISEEILQNDKLGSQMKSFTEWLRSMKKIHPSKLEEQGLITEKLIQHASNESNVNTEILTEAMAEVLIKQDKKEKAIEMFSKLSLINPSKSAYFAARIESIKTS